MKKILFSMLAMAAMVSCTSENDPIDEAKDQPVEIKLNAGVISVDTKAPVTSATSDFTPMVIGWEGSASPTISNEKAWETTAVPFAASATATNITLSKAQYYNINNLTNTYIAGVYPKGTINTDNKVTFTNTNAEADVMFTQIKDAGNRTSAIPITLDFEHKTTQLVIMVKSSDGSFPETEKITAIKLNGAEIPNGIDLIAQTVTYGASVEFTLPGSMPTEKLPSDNGVQAGNAIMVKPYETANSLQLSITTTNGSYPAVTVTHPTMKAGTAYTITLDFKAKSISAQGSVKEWLSDTGTGTVE